MSKAVKIALVAIAVNTALCLLVIGYFSYNKIDTTDIVVPVAVWVVVGGALYLFLKSPRFSRIVRSRISGVPDFTTLKGHYDSELNELGEIVSKYLGNNGYLNFLNTISRKDIILKLIDRSKQLSDNDKYHTLLGVAIISWPDELGDVVSYAKKAVELKPKMLLPRHVLGRVYESKGMADEAIQEYEAAKNSAGVGLDIIIELDERIENIRKHGPERLSSTSGSSLSLLHG